MCNRNSKSSLERLEDKFLPVNFYHCSEEKRDSAPVTDSAKKEKKEKPIVRKKNSKSISFSQA